MNPQLVAPEAFTYAEEHLWFNVISLLVIAAGIFFIMRNKTKRNDSNTKDH